MALEIFFEPAYSVEVLSSEDLGPEFKLPQAVRNVAFNILPFDLDVAVPFSLAKRNPHALSILAGRENSEKLDESALGAKTDDPESLRRWREVRRAAVRELHYGGVFINTRTGIRGPAKGRYYSDGAAELFKHGTRMTTYAEFVEYEFPMSVDNS